MRYTQCCCERGVFGWTRSSRVLGCCDSQDKLRCSALKEIFSKEGCVYMICGAENAGVGSKTTRWPLLCFHVESNGVWGIQGLDPEYVNNLLGSLPGVSVGDPAVQNAISELQQKQPRDPSEKKDEDGK